MRLQFFNSAVIANSKMDYSFPALYFVYFGCISQLLVVPDTEFEIFIFLCLSRQRTGLDLVTSPNKKNVRISRPQYCGFIAYSKTFTPESGFKKAGIHRWDSMVFGNLRGGGGSGKDPHFVLKRDIHRLRLLVQQIYLASIISNVTNNTMNSEKPITPLTPPRSGPEGMPALSQPK